MSNRCSSQCALKLIPSARIKLSKLSVRRKIKNRVTKRLKSCTTSYVHVVRSHAPQRALTATHPQFNYDSIIDTGATSHILRSDIFASRKYAYSPTNTKVALGDHGIELSAIGTCTVGVLHKALIVPQMSLNLISASALEKIGYSLTVANSQCDLMNAEGTKVFTAILVDGLYCFILKDLIRACDSSITAQQLSMVARVKKPSVISTKLDVELLHKRFGHASVEDIMSGLRHGAITGFVIDAKREHGKYQLQNGVCSTCMKAKSHKPPYYISMSNKATVPGELLVCDIQGRTVWKLYMVNATSSRIPIGIQDTLGRISSSIRMKRFRN